MTTILILGASRGIGLEFARQHLQAGDAVVATARGDAALQTLAAMGARALRLEVTEPASVAALKEAVGDAPIDQVLFVAGVFGPRAGASAPPSAADFDAIMRANVFGAMQAIPAFGPQVEAAGGVMAFVTSGLGSITEASSSHGWLYRASKAALNMAVHAAAFDYPKARFVAISPGWVKTDMGGPGATLSVEESVAGMRGVLASLDPSDSGTFRDQNGGVLPW